MLDNMLGNLYEVIVLQIKWSKLVEIDKTCI